VMKMTGKTLRFVPRRAFIEEGALQYPLGQLVAEKMRDLRIPVSVLERGQRPAIPGRGATRVYEEAKNTLVVRVRRRKTFETCKPSAHYQLPLVTSCPGLCEYCYLQTRLGPRPYVRVYANIEEILDEARKLIVGREPETTVFEGAATSDPVAVEWLTGALKRTIEFFGNSKRGRFRFVTKFADIDPILDARHGGHTTVRVSVNAAYVIKTFEHLTSSLNARIQAVSRAFSSGYPIGVMVGPIITFDGWRDEYEAVLAGLGKALPRSAAQAQGIPFELITHRFTKRAKDNILSVFPNTRLPMDESERRLVFGQFGYTKHVYPKETMREIEAFFSALIPKYVPDGYIQYLV
jgi:spore photoproduct lyase